MWSKGSHNWNWTVDNFGMISVGCQDTAPTGCWRLLSFPMRTEPSASTAAALTSASIFPGWSEFLLAAAGQSWHCRKHGIGKRLFFFPTAYVFKASSTEVDKGLKSERDLRYHWVIITPWSGAMPRRHGSKLFPFFFLSDFFSTRGK